MAVQTKYLDCEHGAISWEHILAAVITKDAEDNHFIRVVNNTPECANLSDAYACDDGELDLFALLSKAIVLDCEGKPAINLAACTC